MMLATALAFAFVATPMAAQKEPQKEPTRRLKLRVAIAPVDFDPAIFVDGFQFPVEFRTAMTEKLTKRLTESGRFLVLEREALQAIEQEQAIKAENTGDRTRGKTVFAQALVRTRVTDFAVRRRGVGIGVNVGGIGRVGTDLQDAHVGVSVRLLDVDTSSVLSIQEGSGSSPAAGFRFNGNDRLAFLDFNAFDNSPLGHATTKALRQAADKLVKELRDVPWTARIADVEGEIAINAGSDAGVRVGDEFLVIRRTKQIKDPETGETLGSRTTRIGRLAIKSVQPRLAFGQMVDGDTPVVGDVVLDLLGTPPPGK